MLTSTPASATAELRPVARRRSPGFWSDALRRVVRSRAAMSGGVIVGLFVLLAVLAPLLAPYEPLRGRVVDRLQGPSAEHWLGTDELGRDVLSRVLYGARISLQIQVAAVGLALLVGTALGVTAGYVGRWPDMLIMRLVDIMMAFPGIFLALAIIAALGTGLGNVIIASAIFLVPQFARVVRGSVLTLKEKEFVEAARALGEGAPHRLRPVLSRPRRPAPQSGMGGHALERARLHDHRAPRRHRAGPRHHARGPWLQPPRRRPSRRPRPEAERMNASAKSAGAPGYGSDIVIELLRAVGVEHVAINPGATFRGLHDSLVNYAGAGGPELVLTTHEEIAVALAHGYAKAKGRPMAAVVHDIVGLQHASMAIFNAFCDRVPVLVLGATGPMDTTRRRPWIDWIHTALVQGNQVRDYVKLDDQPASVAAIPEALLRAWRLARTEPQGPVYLCLDAGLQEEPLASSVALPDVTRFRPAAPPHADPRAIDAAACRLVDARFPVILTENLGRRPGVAPLLCRLAESLA